MILGVSSIQAELPSPPFSIRLCGGASWVLTSESASSQHDHDPQKGGFPRSPGWDVAKQRVESGPVLFLYRNIFYEISLLTELSPKPFASGTIIHP